MGRVFVNGPGDLGSISGHVIPKTLKMVLDTSLLNSQHYKVRIKGKVEQSGERSSALLYTSVVDIEKEPSGCPRLRSPTLLLLYTYIYIYIYMCVRVCVCVCEYTYLRVYVFRYVDFLYWHSEIRQVVSEKLCFLEYFGNNRSQDKMWIDF